MRGQKQNYYGSLCTEMYEILHREAPPDELAFYLSYARPGDKILEPLCGSGRFLIPFLERGFDIKGMDLSAEMLEKLRQKAPGADVVQADITEYVSAEQFDYIFISSGSVSLFTDMDLCREILRKIKGLLAPGGRFVFAVDTVADRGSDGGGSPRISVKTREGFDLVLKDSRRYDETTQTLFLPGVYELYQGARLLQSETMDFQLHLYRFGEMEQCLQALGFTEIKTYSSFSKELAVNDGCENFLLECRTGP